MKKPKEPHAGIYKNWLLVFPLVVSLAGLLSCQKEEKESEKLQAPLFGNLGKHGLKVTTSSEMAQRFFNQGLKLTYGFNHAEAGRSFREAIRLDSACAMCYWGAAYVLGTNYNAAMDEAVRQEAQQLTQKALTHLGEVQDWEKALIKASASRYDYQKGKEQPELDRAYAEAMAEVIRQFPENDDLTSFYAESLMNLHPWDLYTRQGEAKPWTPEILRILETVLARNPDHPGANHLYIHAVEASDQPEKGLPMADRLGKLMPGAGHLVHMPSHIYIRTGHGTLPSGVAGE